MNTISDVLNTLKGHKRWTVLQETKSIYSKNVHSLWEISLIYGTGIKLACTSQCGSVDQWGFCSDCLESVLIGWWLLEYYPWVFFKVRSFSSTFICCWRNIWLEALLLRPDVASQRVTKTGCKVRKGSGPLAPLEARGGGHYHVYLWRLHKPCFIGWAKLKYSVLFPCSYLFIIIIF